MLAPKVISHKNGNLRSPQRTFSIAEAIRVPPEIGSQYLQLERMMNVREVHPSGSIKWLEKRLAAPSRLAGHATRRDTHYFQQKRTSHDVVFAA
jgi:hypothetical protein